MPLKSHFKIYPVVGVSTQMIDSSGLHSMQLTNTIIHLLICTWWAQLITMIINQICLEVMVCLHRNAGQESAVVLWIAMVVQTFSHMMQQTSHVEVHRKVHRKVFLFCILVLSILGLDTMTTKPSRFSTVAEKNRHCGSSFWILVICMINHLPEEIKAQWEHGLER